MKFLLGEKYPSRPSRKHRHRAEAPPGVQNLIVADSKSPGFTGRHFFATIASAVTNQERFKE
jgi:hypothetical protein